MIGPSKRRTMLQPQPTTAEVKGATKGVIKGIKGGPVGMAKGAVQGGYSAGVKSGAYGGKPQAPKRTESMGARSGGMGKGAGKSLSRAFGGTSAVKLLKAEFVLCMVILGLSPLADQSGEEGLKDALKRCAACMGVFFLLGLVSAGGPRPAKAAAGFGGLMTIALALSSRDVFGAVASRIQEGFSGAPTQPLGGVGDDTLGMPDVSGASAGTGPDGSTLSDLGGGGLGPGGTPMGGGMGGGLGPGGTPFGGGMGGGLGPGGIGF